jgi:hypothetical protein
MIHYITNVIVTLMLATGPVDAPVSPAASAYDKVADDWKTLSEENFSISYPAVWQLDQSKAMGTTFVLFARGIEAGKFRENVNLMIQDLTGMGLDLDKYVQMSEQQFKTMITNGKLISSKRIKEGQYHEIVATGTQGVMDLKFKQYYWVRGNRAYVLTFTALQTTYDAYEALAGKVMNTFKVK